MYEVCLGGRNAVCRIIPYEIHMSGHEICPMTFRNHFRNREKKLNQMSPKSKFQFFSWNGLHPSHIIWAVEIKCEEWVRSWMVRIRL